MRRFNLMIALLVVLLAACNSIDYKKTKAGVPYKIFSKGKGDTIHQNDIVKFQVIQKIKDSILVSSYQQGMSQYIQIQPVPNVLRYSDIGGNVMEILPKAKKGDSIYLVQSADSLIKQNPQLAMNSPFKKGEQLITTIKIEEIYKTPEEANAAVTKEMISQSGRIDKENLARFRKDTMVQTQMNIDNKIIEDYLKANNIQAQKTEWGVYMQVIDPGQGPRPAAGQYVTIKYRGTNLEGQEFDSGTFPMQIGMGGAIKGFEEGVRQLAKGGKAKVYIPSMLGYGPQGSGAKIKPNQILVFDLEVLDISNDRPAQVQGPEGGQ
ncbi:MAG: FKBP-type peptidyl-prolyl cis-trans isomerase [Flavisolibacter sp.]|nr:FKBP-type peptidyl-prolyl cis-trans isomerase [Flavisolibacter sp.]